MFPIEWNKVDRKELFLLVRESFLRDFSFNDVRDQLVNGLLTEDECDAILAQPTEQHQLDKLFFLLTYNENKSLQEFVDKLRRDYPWLSGKVEQCIQSPSTSTMHADLGPYNVCITNSCMPNNRNVFVYRCQFLWSIIDRLKRLRPKEYLIIRGNLGYGKSWLAMDACGDFSVIRAMDFRIYWLNVDKCDSSQAILEKMQELKIMIDMNYNCDTIKLSELGTNELKIIAMKKHFQTFFRDSKHQEALLVLCNVKNKRVLEAFDLHCKILATTRNESCFDDIGKNRKGLVVIDHGLTVDEILEFFRKLGIFGSKSYQAKVRLIHKLSKGAPIIVRLISNNIVQSRNAESRLQNYIDQLRCHELNDDQLYVNLDESLRILSAAEREAYQRLVIFPTYSDIPVSVLQRYWSKSEFETEELVNKLYRCSLLAVNYPVDKERATMASMHYIYSSYLNQSIKPETKKQYHQDLINSYDIDRILSHRPEPGLPELENDMYIHYYMGYHLKEAGYDRLFSKLFLDFEFLEQKLRFTGLSNTIGDLTNFHKEIIMFDTRKARLLDELLSFLPSIEEMIYQSDDTCLLQYCLQSHGTIYEEAKSQAKRFRNRVWFKDIDHSQKRRQIVQLHAKPTVFSFVDPNSILVALNNHSILLMDLSPNYTAEPTWFKGHRSKVSSIMKFKDHFISLDRNGLILVWSLVDTSIQLHGQCKNVIGGSAMATHRTNRDRGHLPVIQNDHNINHRKPIQRIGPSPRITCYTPDFDNSRLHCATDDGKILTYKWNDTGNFQLECSHHTGVEHIQCIHFITNNYIMVLTKIGNIAFFDQKTMSETPFTKKWVKFEDPVAIYQPKPMVIFCVFKKTIIKFKISSSFQSDESMTAIMIDAFEPIYTSDDEITCSSLTSDGAYMALGTKQGIVVFSCANSMDVLRNSVGDRISCIDIYCTGDEVYRYVIITGTQHGQNNGNIYGLKVNGENYIVWAPCNLHAHSDEQPSFHDYSTWLVGSNLFEVIMSVDSNECILFAIDSKNRIHLYSIRKNNAISQTITQPLQSRIEVTCIWKESFYFGCTDGYLYKFGEETPQLQLTSAIVFLKELNGCLVVGTILEYYLLGTTTGGKGRIVDCYAMDDAAILVVLEDNRIIMQRVTDGKKIMDIKLSSSRSGLISGCDFRERLLAVVDNEMISIFQIINYGNGEDRYQISGQAELKICENHVTAVALSPNAEYLAVGLRAGGIEIYLAASLKRIHTLLSHKQQINALVFSPNMGSINNPLVLVSLSEQICFWNISYVINNPMGEQQDGRGVCQRFAVPLRKFELNGQGDLAVENIRLESLDLKVDQLPSSCWENKVGPSGKRELLTCIKFVGNRADKLVSSSDFKRFVTLDNSGEIYALSVRRPFICDRKAPNPTVS